MRENEFEKRVQDKMSEFRLSPSGEVWQQVERRIRREKKRRFIFWWPLFFLLAGGGIVAGKLLTNKKERTEPAAVSSQIDNNQPFYPDKAKEKQPGENIADISGNDSIGYTIKDDKISNEPPAAITGATPNGKVVKMQKPLSGVNQPGIKKGENDAGIEITKELQAKDDPKDEVSKQTATVTDPPRRDEPIKEPGINYEKAVEEKKVELQQKETREDPVQSKTGNTATKENIKPAEKNAGQWDWGFGLSAGRSSVVEGFRFFNGPLYADASTLQTGSSGNPSGIPVSRAAMQPSFSWSAGFYREKSISEKLHINIGLAYHYLSTRISVGNRVDSTRSVNNTYSQGLTVSDFYRYTGNATYTNKYHFISLSGELSWRIINGNKVKLYWENGLGYSRLLGSTMLHYDRGLPGYYRDNRLLTKNNLFYTTGLALPVGARWSVNPFASYGLTRVLKDVDSSRTHYSNFGIRIRYLLNKK